MRTAGGWPGRLQGDRQWAPRFPLHCLHATRRDQADIGRVSGRETDLVQ